MTGRETAADAAGVAPSAARVVVAPSVRVSSVRPLWGGAMQTRVFQGKPDDFDMDGYFSSRPGQPVWLVTRYASEIVIGDRVYIWRNQGTRGAIAGVVAEAIVTTAPMVRAEDHDALRFWRTEGPRRDAPQMRAGLRLVKVASAREVLQRSWCADDPILRNLPNLQMAAGTNYPVRRDPSL